MKSTLTCLLLVSAFSCGHHHSRPSAVPSVLCDGHDAHERDGQGNPHDDPCERDGD